MAGESVFFTGVAGSGKSFVLQLLKKLLRLEGSRTYRFTGTTGIAACNIGGTTIHSFAGIGLGKGPIDKVVGKVLGNKQARKRWVFLFSLFSFFFSLLFHGRDNATSSSWTRYP